MPKNTPTFQTLSEFLQEPFWNSDSKNYQKLQEYEKRYQLNEQKIKLHSYTQVDNSYYFHVTIPSDSQKASGVYYDVVIRFFTNKESELKASHIRGYYIQFFSNSPGFIYNYAVLYRKHGFLIDLLYDKLDPRYFDKLPEKRNTEHTLSYDKSIYFACKFLSEHKFRVLNKMGIPFGRNLSPSKFFQEIKDFQTIKIENDLLALERKAMKDLVKSTEEKAKDASKKNELLRQQDNHRKFAVKSTSPIQRVIRKIKKGATKSTSRNHPVRRKALKSTTKKH